MVNQVQALVDRHAKNLVRLARSQQVVNQLHAEVADLLTVFEDNQLHAYFSDLSLSHEDKLKLARLLGQPALDILASFFEQILHESQETYLYPILQRTQELLGYERSEVDVYVTTVVPLTDDQRQKMLRLANRQLAVVSGRLVEKLDESLIGGFILEANHQVIDTSIRRQLQDLKHETTLR